jgi:hypothetical protein
MLSLLENVPENVLSVPNGRVKYGWHAVLGEVGLLVGVLTGSAGWAWWPGGVAGRGDGRSISRAGREGVALFEGEGARCLQVSQWRLQYAQPACPVRRPSSQAHRHTGTPALSATSTAGQHVPYQHVQHAGQYAGQHASQHGGQRAQHTRSPNPTACPPAHQHAQHTSMPGPKPAHGPWAWAGATRPGRGL